MLCKLGAQSGASSMSGEFGFHREKSWSKFIQIKQGPDPALSVLLHHNNHSMKVVWRGMGKWGEEIVSENDGSYYNVQRPGSHEAVLRWGHSLRSLNPPSVGRRRRDREVGRCDHAAHGSRGQLRGLGSLYFDVIISYEYIIFGKTFTMVHQQTVLVLVKILKIAVDPIDNIILGWPVRGAFSQYYADWSCVDVKIE